MDLFLKLTSEINENIDKINKLYKERTWNQLLCESEKETQLSKFNQELSRAVYRKWLATDSYSYFSFIYKLAQDKFKVKVSDLSAIDQKRLLMLYYDLFETAGRFKNLQDMIDELFAQTAKTILRDRNEIYFSQYGEVISPYLLSSGEKQLLVILLTALVQESRPAVLFMDEPEVSLHIEWQQRLISLIRTLNPNVQIILCTHSPAIIMDGWMDAVTEISEIVKE